MATKLITHKRVEWLAQANGYGEFWEGYVEDNDLARCDACRMWGKFGEDVVGDGTDNFCEAHRPANMSDAEIDAETDDLEEDVLDREWHMRGSW